MKNIKLKTKSPQFLIAGILFLDRRDLNYCWFFVIIFFYYGINQLRNPFFLVLCNKPICSPCGGLNLLYSLL